ncbi:MAG: hypothetical protein LBG60_09590 [Bifidobacteriaceae bacterium]|nr:hypothetical protein [Bifidobacteriaceae bacterium]
MNETIMIRGVDPEVKRRLRLQAADNDRSLTAEARSILTDAVMAPARVPARSLADVFGGLTGVSDIDLDAVLPQRRVDPDRRLDLA